MSESIIEDKKYCSKCEVRKPVSQFGVYNRNKDGLNKNCKECVRNNVYTSRIRQKIMNDSSVVPKIEKNKRKIRDTDDPDELIRLYEKGLKLARFKKIEAESTPENTLNLTYEVIFGDKPYDRNAVKFEENLKLKFSVALLNAQVDFMGNDIQLIIFKTRCKAVIHGIKDLTDVIKQGIAERIRIY